MTKSNSNTGCTLDVIVNGLEGAYQDAAKVIGELTEADAARALNALAEYGFHPDNSETRNDAERAAQVLLDRHHSRKVLEEASYFDIDLRVHNGRVQVEVLANGFSVHCQHFAEWKEGYAAGIALRDFLSLSYPTAFSYQAFPPRTTDAIPVNSGGDDPLPF